MINDIFINSLFGLIPITMVSVVNIFMIKKATIGFIVLIQCLGLVSIFFSSLSLLYWIVISLGLFYLLYKKRHKEDFHLDFSDKVYSISGLLNKRKKTDGVVVGEVLPNNTRELKYNGLKVSLSETILSGGTLIQGSTGSGKTEEIKSIIFQSVERGNPVCFVEFKGSADTLEDIENFANKKNIPYYEFSSRKCNFTYDPFLNLNETGKVEAIMNTRKWDSNGSDEYYKTSMQLFVQNIVREYEQVKDDSVPYLIGLYKYALEYKPDINEKDGYYSVLRQLEILLSSKFKELCEQDKQRFEFESITNNKPYIIVFSFVSANKQLGNSVASFVFQDIMNTGTILKYNKKLLLCVDEFGTVENSTIIKDILEKGRSCGVMTVFSLLDINQIAMSNSIYFIDSILGTINTLIIFAGATQKSAEILAGVQRWDNKSFDIMSLRKPQGGKPPTALFISKYNILMKGSQEMYRMIPFRYKSIDKQEESDIVKPTPIEDEIEQETKVMEEIKIDDIDDIL